MVGLALGLFLSLYQHGGAGDKKTDLQGTWTIVSSEFEGAPQKRAIGGKLIFDGGKFTFKDKLKDSPGRFVLDTSTKPKQFDFLLDDNKNVFGIFDLDGDTLKLCFVKGGEKGSRPTEFVSKKDTNIVLLVLKREKSGGKGGERRQRGRAEAKGDIVISSAIRDVEMRQWLPLREFGVAAGRYRQGTSTHVSSPDGSVTTP
jgi:uncharacterized protein (TIGR03067 family)